MSRTVCLFCLLFFFVQGVWGVDLYPPTPLPSHPELKQSVENKVVVFSPKNSLTWNLQRTLGMQQFELRQTLITPVDSPLPKQPPMYQYKGMIINVSMGRLFSIGSILTLGYEEDKFPVDFSFFSLPKQERLWNTLQYSILINKNFTLWDTLIIAPFGGFSFSQYNLNIVGADYPLFYRRYQSSLVGTGILYTPCKYIDIDFSLSFSPYNLVYDMQNSLSQFSYKFSTTFKNSFFSFTGIISSERNFEHVYINNRKNTLVVYNFGFYLTFDL